MDSQKSHFHDYSHAKEYDQRAGKSGIRVELTAKLMDSLELKGDEKILDLATGTGHFADPASRRLKNGFVVGLDEALAMLKVAQEKPIQKFRPIVAAAESFPFREGVFDRAFTTFAFHHFTDPGVTSKQVLRVLKREGLFAILEPVLVPARDQLDEEIHAIINRILSHNPRGHFTYHSAKGIGRVLTQTGFRIVRDDVHTFEVDQEGMGGVPTGRHWLDVGKEFEKESPLARGRFEESYFRHQIKGDSVRVQGKFSFALISAARP
jgi:SAM-dependent methyltransferase